MKIKEINGEYWIREGKTWRKISPEEAIDRILGELRRIDDAKLYRIHGNGD